MKSAKFLSFFFIMTLIAVGSINLHNLEASDQINDFTGKFFAKRADYENNRSLVYVFVEGEELNINIQCDTWFNTVSSGYQGLLVEIKDDSTEEIIKSWLILYGDEVEHRFTSEFVLEGVYQIIFTILNVDTVDFLWQINNNIPIWSYELSINNLEEIFFGIERFVEYYSSIDKMVIQLTTQEWTDIEYTVSFGSVDNQIYVNFVGNFSLERHIVESVIFEEGLKPHQWYKIGINCPIDKNDSLVTFKIFYDHEQLENTARIFLSRGEVVLDEIPLDKLHSHPSFLWEKQEPVPDPYPPIPPYNPDETIKYVLLSIYFSIYVVTILLVAIRFVKKKKKEKSKIVVASEKYHSIENNTVKYSPETYYPVNFKAETPEYNLVTDSEVNITCSICLQIIHSTKEIIRCPSCDIAYHKNHLYEWLKQSGNCPACKAKLRMS
ncbi:MAG: RING finger domain-containing protein [Candidatus Heimdallarchaeaceae archaeon]